MYPLIINCDWPIDWNGSGGYFFGAESVNGNHCGFPSPAIDWNNVPDNRKLALTANLPCAELNNKTFECTDYLELLYNVHEYLSIVL